MFEIYMACKSQMVASAILDFGNVSNCELNGAICAKFGGQMHKGHAEMTHDQKLKPEVFLRDVIIMMNKGVYIKRMSGT